MTTSKGIFPRSLTQIDELTRPDHFYLEPEDKCWYLGEFTSKTKEKWSYSETNQIIYNFKKGLDHIGTDAWRYKERDIARVAAALKGAITAKSMLALTWVPLPPSKSRNDPLHDDRGLRLLKQIDPDADLDIRELVVQYANIRAAHDNDGDRPKPREIAANYKIDEQLAKLPPKTIAVFDDTLTTGSHFKAMQLVLRERFPDAKVIGIFIARRVFPPLPQ